MDKVEIISIHSSGSEAHAEASANNKDDVMSLLARGVAATKIDSPGDLSDVSLYKIIMSVCHFPSKDPPEI